MHLFYTPDIQGNTYQLSEEESKHAARVLRLDMGDEIILTDGKGNWMISEIIDPHPKRCLVQVNETKCDFNSKPYELHMAVAPTKNINRFEWYLEKATEIGIDVITPIRTEHSERKEIKWPRLQKVITSAMKQSLKAWHPELKEMMKFKDLINQDFDGKKLIAWCEADKSDRIDRFVEAGEKALILIGPEGGFSPEEVNEAKDKGFEPVSISSSRLRTETAAVVACHSIAFINQS
ncbi:MULTISPECIES: 16S rRNA (uracil(1498)-N(3))-methyltransferase [unclassified Lentimicrobium]|uniref:16S rRNA (uracil(1498)-N(3))-methyltransferase n=1 Tax=unclassified Lentimicrobium TaxID=2677434 RepID=UPI0015570967|nr:MULTISPECIES: 16S rRNA (uracil(1498)-N(3))-methyltransferase [unclassified Lentimicrobium]NPD46715.1 16S rRNA (uracil(1498)-N(3))-methyltransferase [Lentimicrobium sp. S6]NPD85509.1 16S rRNA (uracil(1498)-N(3))-methyltransferase [Lentimicrobium sp. L6]